MVTRMVTHHPQSPFQSRIAAVLKTGIRGNLLEGSNPSRPLRLSFSPTSPDCRRRWGRKRSPGSAPRVEPRPREVVWMAGLQVGDFDSPDEVRSPDKTRVDVVRMGDGATAASRV